MQLVFIISGPGEARPRGYKTFFMLNSTEQEIFPASTFVGILTFMNRKNSILSLSESEKKAAFLDIFILLSI